MIIQKLSQGYSGTPAWTRLSHLKNSWLGHQARTSQSRAVFSLLVISFLIQGLVLAWAGPLTVAAAASPTSLPQPAKIKPKLSIQGLHVSGNQILNSDSQAVRLVGVNRQSSEYACIDDFGFFSGPYDDASVAAIASWNATAVRVPLNEDCWLAINNAPAAYSGAVYINAISSFVASLNSHGLVAILDLHWNGPGSSQAVGQQPMADEDHAPAFWTSVANTFKNNSSVIFDLYNEPYPDNNSDSTAAWTCLRDGGICNGVGYKAAGMQELVNTVRSTGATNIVIIGGVNYANSLSMWLQYKPTDPTGNLAASWHSYDTETCNNQTCWDNKIAPVLAQVPVVTGEIGEDGFKHTYIDSLMSWLDTHQSNYLAWAWIVNPGVDLTLVSDYAGTPTQTYGQGFHDHLATLNMPLTTTTSLASTPNPTNVGQSVTFTAAVSPSAATGTITFQEGATVLGTAALSSGTATFSTASLSVGSHTITATYGGDTNYLGSTSNNVVQVVSATPPVSLSVSPTSLNFAAQTGGANPTSQNVSLNATGTAVNFTSSISYGPSGSGWLSINPTSGTVTPGTATPVTFSAATGSLTAGDYTATVAFQDTANSADTATVTVTFVVSAGSTPSTITLSSAPNPSNMGQSVTFTATVSPTAATGTVTFQEGVTVLGTATLSNGLATFSTAGLSVGSHTITASYSGDTTYLGSTSSNVVQVVNGTPPPPTNYTYYLPLVANTATTPVGQATTFVTFQNLSASASATIAVQYYSLANGTPGNTDNLTLPAKGQKAILPNIGPNNSGGGIITSNQPLNVVVSEIISTGGSAYNVTGQTASTLYSALALNNAFGGFTTNIVVFNTGSSASSGQIQFYDPTGNVAATQSFNIPGHASQTLSQANLSGLSNQQYWAKISATNASDKLTAQVIEFGPSNFVATFNASVPAQAATKLYAPAAFNGLYGYVTGMGFANPNATAANVTVTYYDGNGSAVGSQPLTIQPNGNGGLFQGAAGTSANVASAVISSSQPIVMTINERGPNSVSGTYVGIANGSISVALPVMANGFAGFITGATIFNAGSGNASLTLTYLDNQGNPVGNPQNTNTLAPNASFALYQGASSQGLPSGFFGTAIISSNQPLLVTTNALQTTGLFYTYTEPSS